MRLAFAVSSLHRGGAEKVVSLLASEMAARGHRVKVITLHAAGEDDFPLHPGVELCALQIAHDTAGLGNKLQFTLSRLKRLRGALKQSQPDVVLAFGDQMNVLVLLSAFWLSMPVLISERIHPSGHTLPRLWRMLRWLTYPFARCLVLQSRSISEAFSRIPRVRRAIIGNPVPLTLFARAACRSNPDSPREIIAIGRLAHQKGFDILLDAFASIIKDAPGVRLRIYGEGPERSSLDAKLRALGLQSTVALMGVTTNVCEVFAGADLYVLSSRFEGLPNSMLEAMACGVPVIATDCPGAVAELADFGEYAYLVRPEDPRALAAALRLFLRDRRLREDYGRRAVRGARRYSQPKIIDEWEQLIINVSTKSGVVP